MVRDVSTIPAPAVKMLDPLEAVTAVEAAILLVALAINDTHKPVENLGAALERINGMASAVRSSREANQPQPDGTKKQLAQDVAICIEGLQFHDRLLQQLAFVRDLLSAILKHEPLDVSSYGAPRWAALMAAIRSRAPLDPRFELFDLLSPTEAHSAEGSAELFE
jgi:hypothetical protein